MWVKDINFMFFEKFFGLNLNNSLFLYHQNATIRHVFHTKCAFCYLHCFKDTLFIFKLRAIVHPNINTKAVFCTNGE